MGPLGWFIAGWIVRGSNHCNSQDYDYDDDEDTDHNDPDLDENGMTILKRRVKGVDQ